MSFGGAEIAAAEFGKPSRQDRAQPSQKLRFGFPSELPETLVSGQKGLLDQIGSAPFGPQVRREILRCDQEQIGSAGFQQLAQLIHRAAAGRFQPFADCFNPVRAKAIKRCARCTRPITTLTLESAPSPRLSHYAARETESQDSYLPYFSHPNPKRRIFEDLRAGLKGVRLTNEGGAGRVCQRATRKATGSEGRLIGRSKTTEAPGELSVSF